VVLDKPHPKAINVDLSGYTIFPGLINAHDHLELNHFPRTKFRERYDNAHQWGEDINARLNESPFKELRAYPLEDRLLIGGLKNLLCGATTVAHHNPPHKPLFRKDFPVRVLRKYGWAHSLHFDSWKKVQKSCGETHFTLSWFIHLAEGTDEVAAGEFRKLRSLGCGGPNLVIIHGVGLDWQDSRKLADWWIRGLVWCPSTNIYLLGKTTEIEAILHAGFVKGIALGSDSRGRTNHPRHGVGKCGKRDQISKRRLLNYRCLCGLVRITNWQSFQ
jgi:cytosine/adenosine deaminase-related metal-dependent hydrolase